MQAPTVYAFYSFYPHELLLSRTFNSFLTFPFSTSDWGVPFGIADSRYFPLYSIKFGWCHHENCNNLCLYSQPFTKI